MTGLEERSETLSVFIEKDLSRGPPTELESRVNYAVNSGRFVVIWKDPLIAVYLGEHGDYVIVDGVYCSCEGFMRRISSRGVGGCSHVFAARRVFHEGEGRFREVDISVGEAVDIVWEVLTGGLTKKLREKLYIQDKTRQKPNE